MRKLHARRLWLPALTVAAVAAAAPGTALAADCGMDLTDPEDVTWSVNTNGAVSDAAADAYDTYGTLRLIVGADTTNYAPADPAACTFEDLDREIAYPALTTPSGLELSRKFYVPAAGLAFARWIDFVRNPTGAPVTARVEFRGNYGTDSDTQVLETSSGDDVVAVGDAWVALDEDDGDDSKIASLWDSASTAKPDAADDFPDGPASETAPGADDGDDDVTVGYDGVTVAAGETVAFMHVEHVGGSRADVREFANTYEGGSEEFYSGLSSDERSQLRNWTPQSDQDLDGDLFSQDNCPQASNPDQADLDGDGQGDACDADDDGDGLSDAAETELGLDPRKPDTDGDGKPDKTDACPTKAGTTADGCPVTVVTNTVTAAGQARPPRAMSARVSPGSDTRRPHRFRVTGAVTPPDGISVADACTGGTVLVQAKAGRNTIATRQASLRPDCTYAVTLSFNRPRRFGSQTRLRFIARFLGSARMSQITAATVSARVR